MPVASTSRRAYRQPSGASGPRRTGRGGRARSVAWLAVAVGCPVSWVILTRGDRPGALDRAVASVGAACTTIVANGCDLEPPAGTSLVTSPTNVGIPAGRDLGLRAVAATVIGFLDDDAEASPAVNDLVAEAFAADPSLGAVALRLVDEDGTTARRHVPRFGGGEVERPGDVAVFLGGACAVRRAAYEDAGGYWGDLFYGHEELELAWRLIDRGWRIAYLPGATVFHPRTEIGRHAAGWHMTGRNRVMIARRTLPWVIALAHVSAWLGLGLIRAPGRDHRRAYVNGWFTGWRVPVDRRPIRWRTVWRLTRRGRPPVL